MAKNNEEVEVVMEVDGKEVSSSVEKNNKTEKNKDKKKKKEKKQKNNKVKEMVGELKRVTWPSFGTVMIKTGVVLAVVLFFFVVLFGIDWLMSLLHQLIVKAAK